MALKTTLFEETRQARNRYKIALDIGNFQAEEIQVLKEAFVVLYTVLEKAKLEQEYYIYCEKKDKGAK